MSKISIEVDTQNQTMSVTIDGNTLDGAKDVCIYSGKDYDGNSRVSTDISFDSEKLGESGDIHKYVRISASHDEKAKRAVKLGFGKYSEDKSLIIHKPVPNYSKGLLKMMGRVKS